MQRIDLYKYFFTHESDYYAEKLCQFEQGKKYSFNLWAGIFGLTWFCYRKMYKQSAVIFIVTSLFAMFSAIVISFFNPYGVSNMLYSQFVVWPLSFIVLGFLGNYLYLKKSKLIVEEFISSHGIENADYKKAVELRRRGGTSMTSALICVGLLILLQIFS